MLVHWPWTATSTLTRDSSTIGGARVRTSCSKTCCCATNWPSSPVLLEPAACTASRLGAGGLLHALLHAAALKTKRSRFAIANRLLYQGVERKTGLEPAT